MNRAILSVAALSGALLFAPASVIAADLYQATGKVSKFMSASCAIETGKVDTANLNGQPIAIDKNGCLTVKGKDKTDYFVRRPVKKRECRDVAMNSVTTDNAGSAAANESCKPVNN